MDRVSPRRSPSTGICPAALDESRPVQSFVEVVIPKIEVDQRFISFGDEINNLTHVNGPQRKQECQVLAFLGK